MRLVTEITEEEIGGRLVFAWEVYDADEMHAPDGSRLFYGRGLTETEREAEALAEARVEDVADRAAARERNER